LRCENLFSFILLMRVSNWFGPAARQWMGLAIAVIAGLGVSSCATIGSQDAARRLEQTAGLIEEVKSFGKTLGIEPTQALSKTAREGPPLAMLWVWMQREGTLALSAPVDIRMAIGYGAEKERLRIEQVYRVDGYSVYYRQGNEFADSRSLATAGFAEEPIVRRVKVILHEDLHGEINFALPWEIEEGIATPLGSLATVEYFRWKGDESNLRNAATSVNQERQAARELTLLAAQAQNIFAQDSVEMAKEKILALLHNYPAYQKQFERQVRGQHVPTVVEAKLSHDLAYYRYYDRIAALAELAPNLKTLIADLKAIPANAPVAIVDEFLRNLENNYGAENNSRGAR
jgi:hypothetical protein